MRTSAEQEQEDSRLYHKLSAQADPYKETSNARDIQIDNELYSIHWLLLYAQARNAGIACMYRSGGYANERMFPHRDGAKRECYSCYEPYDLMSRERDAKFLANANEYLREHGLYQKPKGKLVLETA